MSVLAPRKILQAVLRSLRAESGLTQREVAERLGVPQSYVSKYETGEKRLDLVELVALASALGIGLGDIVRRFEEALREGR